MLLLLVFLTLLTWCFSGSLGSQMAGRAEVRGKERAFEMVGLAPSVRLSPY